MAVETFRKDEKNVATSKRKIFRRVLSYLRPYAKSISFAIFLMVISTLVIIALPLVTERAIDVDVANGDRRGLIVTVSTGIALCIILWIVVSLRMKLMSRMANRIVYDIREDCYAHLETLSLFYFDSRPTGKILSRLINDISNMKDMMSQLVTSIVPNILMIVGILAAMIASNWRLAMSAVIVVPLFVTATYFVTIKGFGNWENYRKKQSNLNAFSHENYSGMKIVEAFVAEKETEQTFEGIIADCERSWNIAVRRSDLMNIVWCLSNGIGLALLYLFAYYLAGIDGSSIGALIAFSSYIGLFWMPIRQLAMTYNQLTNNITAAGRVFELLDTESNLVESEDAEDADLPFGHVVFDHVTFAYPDEPEKVILKDLSFDIPQGRTIALVGATGAGKTTIINLVARFYDPVSGRVLIDGKDISRLTFASLRRSVAVMTQDPFIFTGTIRENLLYGNDDITEDEMRNASRLLGAEEFILAEKDGYDTRITFTSLSQGQRQLIALVRTLLKDPRILILDEATSAIDTKTEILVQKGMSYIMKGRTSFVVAHRLSTIRNADEIFVIERQGIAERGSHDELLKKKDGIYKALYEAQFEDV